MNKILFRAKRFGREEDREYRSSYQNGDWVTGLVSKQQLPDFQDRLLDEMTTTSGVSGVEIDRSTIGQFTGIYDKNGKHIYEGDIVTFTDNAGYYPEDNYTFTGIVHFEKGTFGLGTIHPIDLSGCLDSGLYNDNFVSFFELWDNDKLDCLEVIGNKYDNPELEKLL